MIAVGSYAILYACALLPGLPLGFALFGRGHAGGWIAGAAIGYVLTALTIWAPIRAGIPSALTFAIAWMIVGVVAWLLTRGLPAPLIALPPWTRRDTRALLAVWLLTLIVAIPPFARVGARDAEGNRYYRAYFTADFVWHTALVAEMTKFASPPRNPYLANRPIHYYWTYFLLPSAAAGAGAPVFGDVESDLKVNAVGTALLFVSAIFICAWTALPRAWPVACGVALAIVASSAEGTYALWHFWQRGQPLNGVVDLNIDALSSWWFRGLRIDGLQRCFWWVPQHSMAYALGLTALAVVNAAGSGAPPGAVLIAGLALAGAATINPFVGGIFALTWGLAVLIDALRSGDAISRLARHVIAVVPVVLALAWCSANQMVEGAGSALEFGWLGDARNAPVWTLMLSLGPALLMAMAGLLTPLGADLPPKGGSHKRDIEEGRSPTKSRGSSTESRGSSIKSRGSSTKSRGFRLQADGFPVSAVALASISLLLLYFVRLNVDTSWVGFRAGQMFLVAIPALIARGLLAARPDRAIAIIVTVCALIIGFPTLAIDVYNAQDITNRSDSPIGPWTVTITRDEHDALEWLRRSTPPTAVVQMDPVARGRQTWSLVPSFAQRRMAAGLPISLLNVPEYREKSDRVKAMYATPDAREAFTIARSLRIDYVYVDRVERTAYPAGVSKFDRTPQYFAPAYRNDEVTVYRVQ
jgi:hypothetical protein